MPRPHGADRTDHAIDAHGGCCRTALPRLRRAGGRRPGRAAAGRVACARLGGLRRGRDLRPSVRSRPGRGGAALPGQPRPRPLHAGGPARARLTYDAGGRTERLLTVVKRAARMLNRKGSVAEHSGKS